MSLGEPGAAAGDAERAPSIRVVMMPKDTNALGTIFGGVILSYIDQAGAVEAHRHCEGRIVTVAMREIVFHAPVFVGDLVSFYTSTRRLGTTSITVAVEVEAQRGHPGGASAKVTEAEVVFVHVGPDGRPTPLPARAEGGRPQPVQGS
ncbi:MAG TPA: acyl-CoA thioesterase [Thermoanaerobaculia bacterium]|nr:acyl-CoA thioesterase [Thermoanaerobaculia bacterium]